MICRSAILLLSLAVAPSAAFATGDGWRSERFNIVVRDQGIQDVFKQFGAMAGVPVVLSESVDARVSARFEGATGEQVVDAIAREYGLDWRYDGRRIEVSSNSEQVSRILDMGGVKRDDLIEALEALESYEPRFPISALDGELGLLVGPPRYVAIVEIVLAEMAQKVAADALLDAQRKAAAEAKRIAEEEKFEAERKRLLALWHKRRDAAESKRSVIRNAPLVIRGGQWGG